MRRLAHDEMPVKCHGCAFIAGTEANQHEVTKLYAELCVQSGEPFFCHANAGSDDNLPKGQERICRGFLEEAARRGPQPAWRKAVASEGLRLMEESREGHDVMADATDRLILAGALAARGLR